MNIQTNYIESIRLALFDAMKQDDSVICYGLGVTDPKGIFGSTIGLEGEFGADRVFDMPTSENAMTGVAVGAALGGLRPVMVHQRFDFFLLAMDQLVNSAAKWRFMFGGKFSVPLTIRLIVGQGWGQGPTHAQNYQSWLAHIPGLKVVAPSSPQDSYSLLQASIEDENPVVFIEHRWLHNQMGSVDIGAKSALGKAKIVREGKDVTIVCWSNMVLEALRAATLLEENKISCEIVDIRSLRPLDWKTIESSIQATGRLVVLDNGHTTNGFGGELVAKAAESLFGQLLSPPLRIGLPDYPVPTSYSLTEDYYPDGFNIANQILSMFGKHANTSLGLDKNEPHDVPGKWFKGPF